MAGDTETKASLAVRAMRLAASCCLLAAGWVHLAIAPDHFFHAPAHGLFFALAGVLQLGWGLLFLRWSGPRMRALGLALSGGLVVVWGLTQTVAIPFAPAPEPIEGSALLSKGLELAGFLLLLGLPVVSASQVTRRLIAAVVAGGSVWGAALAVQPLLPQLGHREEEAGGHGVGGAHSHSEATTQHSWKDVWRSLSLLAGDLQREDTFAWQLPPGFPEPRVPADNPMTAAKVELGRYLFYDTRLSANGTQACASCHKQERAFTDGRVVAVGSTGEGHPRNSMSLTNVAYNSSLTWANPVLDTIEKQVKVPMFGLHPVELGITGHEEEVLARFRADARYPRMFRAAFPGEAEPVQLGNAVKALASFTRVLISGRSPYDRFVYQGDLEALSESARRGLDLFFSEQFECHHCHGGFNFTQSTVHRNTAFVEMPFHNTGLYNLDGRGAYPPDNTGVFALTNKPEDMGRFRAPSLRNVELTAPYMHDGSIATLPEVIDFYAAGGRLVAGGAYAGDGRRNPYKSGFVPGFPISAQEKEDLVNFLLSLTDETFIQAPELSDPFAPAPGQPVAVRDLSP